MKPNKKMMIIKLAILVITLFVLNMFRTTIGVSVTNDIAILQMSSTYDSSMWFMASQKIKQVIPLLYVAIPTLLFWKEIKIIFKGDKEIHEKE